MLLTELVLSSTKFQKSLLLPRIGPQRPGESVSTLWNGGRHLSQCREIEPLPEFSLDELHALARSEMAPGDDRVDHYVKAKSALKDIGKRLTLIYVEAAGRIAELLRDEWRVRRDVFDFNRRAAGWRVYVEPLFEVEARYWRPAGEMGFNILLPHPTPGRDPLLAGSYNPAKIEGWDDRA